MPKIHIDKVTRKDGLYPLIVNYQNGYATENLPSQSCGLYFDKKTGVKTFATEVDGLTYYGNEEPEELGRTFILKRNQDTGKVRLLEVGYAYLKPILESKLPATETAPTTNLELSRAFGSKKMKSIMEQREKLKINVAVIEQQMQNVVQNVTQDQLDLSSYNKRDSDDFYVPPINRKADKIENVYKLRKILSKHDFKAIYSELEDKDYNSELNTWIHSMLTKKDNASHQDIVLAVYASCLLKVYLTSGKDILKKNYVACTLSPTLNKIILDNFTTVTNGRRGRPIPYKDKALCHAIVFILLMNNYKFDLDGLCKAQKITLNNASVKVRLAGATVVGSGEVKTAHLKLPLAAIPMHRRRSTKF